MSVSIGLDYGHQLRCRLQSISQGEQVALQCLEVNLRHGCAVQAVLSFEWCRRSLRDIVIPGGRVGSGTRGYSRRLLPVLETRLATFATPVERTARADMNDSSLAVLRIR